MLALFLRRVLLAILVLLGVSIISFFTIKLAPGDPLTFVVSDYYSLEEDEKEAVKERLGLNSPLYIQYLYWVTNLLKGNFGTSLPKGAPVLEMLYSPFAATLELLFFSFVFSVTMALLLGVYSSRYPESGILNYLVSLLYLLSATPGFFLGLLMIYFFSVYLGVLPVSGMKSLTYYELETFPYFIDLILHVLLPAFTLGIGNGLAGEFLRHLKSEMKDIYKKDYIRKALAMGISPRSILFKHALKNGAIPFLTVILFRIPAFVSGAVVVEYIFSWPGMGLLIIDAVFQRDYPVIMMACMVVATMVVIFNQICQIIILNLDPRIKKA